MHFLGLAGMPRRIPDFPDAYSEWNFIATFGSLITTISTIFFFFVVFNTITANTRIGFNPWRNITLFNKNF